MNELLDGKPFPGTGPYTVTATTEHEVRLGRNPRFPVVGPRRPSRRLPRRGRLHRRPEQDATHRDGRQQRRRLHLIDRRRVTRPPGTDRDTTRRPVARRRIDHGLGGDEYVHPTVRQDRGQEGGQLRDRSRPHGRTAGPRRCRHLPGPAAGLPGLPAVLPVYRRDRRGRPMDGARHAGRPATHRCVGYARTRRDTRSRHRRRGQTVRVHRASPRGSWIPRHARLEEHPRPAARDAVVGPRSGPRSCSTGGSRITSRRPTSSAS